MSDADKPRDFDKLNKPIDAYGADKQYDVDEQARDIERPYELRETPYDVDSEEGAVAAPPQTIRQSVAERQVYKHRGLLLSSYWLVSNEATARIGDVVVVLPDKWLVLKRVKRPDTWVDADDSLYVRGRIDKQICIYGYIPRNAIDHIAEMARSGAVIAAMCDPRKRVRPPRHFELQMLWRTDGYLVNLSPAKLAVFWPDDGGKRYFLADIAKKGCPVYSHFANQLLQRLGVLARLVC